jgi:diguanylate cyclase (GGDEF)-like protein
LPVFECALLWFATEVPSTQARVIVFGLGIAPWCLGIAATLLRHAPAALAGTARIAATAFLLHGLWMLARCILPQEGTSTVDLLRPAWPQLATMLEIFVASLATLLALPALLTHRLMIELEQAARIDPLTGVLNRRAIEEEGEKAIALSAEMALPCAVLLLDLDRFKQINDRHGHPAGDAALRHFAQLIGSALRHSDRLGRYGGEEFLAVIPGADGEEARAAAERLRRRVSEHPVVVEGRTIPLSVSIGVASGSDALAALVARADEALYRAKSSGRNQVTAIA